MLIYPLHLRATRQFVANREGGEGKSAPRLSFQSPPSPRPAPALPLLPSLPLPVPAKHSDRRNRQLTVLMVLVFATTLFSTAPILVRKLPHTTALPVRPLVIVEQNKREKKESEMEGGKRERDLTNKTPSAASWYLPRRDERTPLLERVPPHVIAMFPETTVANIEAVACSPRAVNGWVMQKPFPSPVSRRWVKTTTHDQRQVWETERSSKALKSDDPTPKDQNIHAA